MPSKSYVNSNFKFRYLIQMKISLGREELLTVLQAVVSVVEKRQTQPILSNVLIAAGDGELVVTGSDLEVEVTGKAKAQIDKRGTTTIPGRKLLDICKSLPAQAVIVIEDKDGKIRIQSGRSRFVLTTLAASDFPSIGFAKEQNKFEVDSEILRDLLTYTQFAMAHQDVRYYLNGLLLEINTGMIRAVATDGHRLALCERDIATGVQEPCQTIIPRKGVSEIQRLIAHASGQIGVEISHSFIRLSHENQIVTVKLVDGKFPDYERVVPAAGTKNILVGRDTIRAALQRTSILSNEKFRGVRLALANGVMTAAAHNPEQEEAEEEFEIDYVGDPLEIGFNVSYLLDVLGVLSAETVRIELSDSNSSCLIQDPSDERAKFVVMPMRL